MNRKFARVKGYDDAIIPQRKTGWSAGYDLAAYEDTECKSGVTLVKTGIKVYMPSHEFLAIYIRSSLAIKKGLMLANSVGIIDADYVDNPDNEGHIMVPIYNPNSHSVIIKQGERIAQGIFQKYQVVNNDISGGLRTGGMGSTGV